MILLGQKLIGKILCPASRGDDSVSDGLSQFGAPGAGFLRQSEVMLQSLGTLHRHGASHPDQFAGAGIQHLLILEVDRCLFSNFHFVDLPF